MKRTMTNYGGCSQLGFGYRAPDSCSDSRFFYWFRLRLCLGFIFSRFGGGDGSGHWQPRFEDFTPGWWLLGGRRRRWW
uniref:Uncharacterized protein n=1 Tax=Helianthus annuus TaxID=4232 RepID=A0A251TH33_HELAN